MSEDDASDLKIKFGMRSDGSMVGAAEPNLPNGLACKCFCPNCNARLVARNKGEHNRPHFAHEASVQHEVAAVGEDNTACSGANETSIHLMAKQIIAESFSVLLPVLVANLGDRSRVLHIGEFELWHKLRDVRLERWCDGLRPDIIGSYAGHTGDGLSRPFAKIGDDIAIEIMVTNRCGQEKIDKLRDKKLAAFEIDLSRERYHATAASLRDAINLAPRKWLYHPMIDVALEKMELDEDSPYIVDDPERARRGAERWQQVVREVQAQAIASGRAVYVSSEPVIQAER